MSYKQGQEPHPSYMDGIKVKISERYKPPPKISLPMSYSQRLTVNKHIQENIPKYDFSFEKNAKECMKALRATKSTVSSQRKERLEKIKEAREKEKQDKMKLEQDHKSDTNIQTDETVYNLNNSSQLNMDNFSTYVSSTGVLIPTQVQPTYTNILTPTPLTDLNTQPYTCQPVDKSPFNISDFEADSSPFDNMALKTINDMAELAIVLQNEDKNNKQSYSSYAPVDNPATYTQAYTNYSGHQYSYPELPSTSAGPYVQPNNCIYSARNSYYYDTMRASTYTSPYQYNNAVHDYNNSFDVSSPQNATITDTNVVPIKTVPDIMKTLQTELNNTHIKTNQSISNHVVSTNHKRNKERSNSESRGETLEDPYKNLPKNLQLLSKNISVMGFPLDRVSRVCKLIGDDQKKIVEHLLAMSDLLDLGFPETQVSAALLQCENDRDKALDKLIL